MSFSFGDQSARAFGLYSYLNTWQVLPKSNNQLLTVSGRDGALDLGQSFAEREIRFLTGFRPQQHIRDLSGKIDLLAEWLSPSKGVQKLILDEFPDRFFMARLAGGLDFLRLLRTMGTMELIFLCPDPYGYALDDESATLTNTGSFSFSRQKGNCPSLPTITVDGDFTLVNKPVLKITLNGETIELSGEWPSGSRLEIHGQNQTARFIRVDAQTMGNAMHCLKEPVFPELKMGANNIEISGERLSLRSIVIKANSRWR